MEKYSLNPYYLKYENLLIELHRLIAEGKGDDDVADVVRDEMDAPWLKLSREEDERLRGLSADLYMLQNDEVYEPYDGTQEQLRANLREAYVSRDANRTLALLRKGPSFIPRYGIASLRAGAYEALGHLETSLLFQRYAFETAPESGHDLDREWFQTAILKLLRQLGRYNEAIEQAEINLTTFQTPDFLFNSVMDLIDCAEHLPSQVREPLYIQAINALEGVLSEPEKLNLMFPLMVRTMYHILGDCYRKIGQPHRSEASHQRELEVLNQPPHRSFSPREPEFLSFSMAA